MYAPPPINRPAHDELPESKWPPGSKTFPASPANPTKIQSKSNADYKRAPTAKARNGVYVMLDVDADANFHIPPGPGEQIDQQLDAAKRAAVITLAQDTILPRLAHSSSFSSSKSPQQGGSSGGPSS